MDVFIVYGDALLIVNFIPITQKLRMTIQVATYSVTSQMELILVWQIITSKGFYSQYIWDVRKSLEHQENCSKIAFAYLHALKTGSSGSHVKRGRMVLRLEHIKAE